MDVVHHALIGGIGAVAWTAAGQAPAGMAFAAGSVLPDLDVFWMAFGKRCYLKRHQGPTHALVLAPLFAVLLSLPFWPMEGFSPAIFVGGLSGLLVHLALDVTNTFGVQLLWPFYSKRYCLDAVFFVDATLWTLTLAAGLLCWMQAIAAAITVYAVLFPGYILLKIRMAKTVLRRTGATRAIPSSINPFVYFILETRNREVITCLYNLRHDRRSACRSYPLPSEPVQQLANRSQAYRDMRGIAENLLITDVRVDGQTTVITAKDLAVRNFGGRFGTTVLTFRNNEVVGEMVDV